MKATRLSITLLLLIISGVAMAQAKPVKVVFDVSSKDTLIHQAVLRHVLGMAKAYPQSNFEVVVYGGALPMMVKDQSSVGDGIASLAGNKNVSFKVCSITMQRYKIEATQLLPGVVVVPDGILEIVTKQDEGWAYIKETHN